MTSSTCTSHHGLALDEARLTPCPHHGTLELALPCHGLGLAGHPQPPHGLRLQLSVALLPPWAQQSPVHGAGPGPLEYDCKRPGLGINYSSSDGLDPFARAGKRQRLDSL